MNIQKKGIIPPDKAPLIKNILVPRFDTLGDIVLLGGFVERLIKVFPHASITLLVREGCEQLAPLFPEGLRWVTTGLNANVNMGDEDLGAISGFLNQVAEDSWDLVLTTTYNRTWLDDVLTAKLADAVSVTINDRPIKNERWFKLLLERLDLPAGIPYHHIVHVDEKIHETAKYQILCDALVEDKKILAAPQLHIPGDVISQAERFLSAIGLADRKFLVCTPAGTQNISIKTWPKDRFAEIISWISTTYGFPPLLTGNEGELEVIESIAEMVEKAGIKAYTWIGKTGEIPVLAAIMKKASLYVGNDTGPLHIAAACGIPVVGIYGGGTWPRFTPVSRRAIAVVGSLPCFGCYWDCILGDAPCMKLIDTDDVKKAVMMVLEGRDLSENVLSSANQISEETLNYLEKVKPYIKDSAEDRAARLEAILIYQHQMDVYQHQMDVIEADRSARLEAIMELQRQLQVSEADRAARLEAIHNYQERIEILSRPETAVKTTILIILRKLKLYNYYARHSSFFDRLFKAVRRRPPTNATTKAVISETDRNPPPGPSINSPVVEALIIARGLDGELDEQAMVHLFEAGRNLRQVLCVDPSPKDLQSLAMLSKAGANLDCISDKPQRHQTDILPSGVTVIQSTLAQWMAASGQTTFPNYDGILMGSQISEETLLLLKGRLWPQTRTFVSGLNPVSHIIQAHWGTPHHSFMGVDIYDAPPESWLDPAQKDRSYYRRQEWPLKATPIDIPPNMPSGRPWPKISVVTVTLNQGGYLEETLRSVLFQGYPHLEYIVIDGGSTDETPEILNRYRFQMACCISEKDKGQSDAINKGFRHASGDILAWLNSDDCYMPGALWRVALAFDTYATDMVAGGCALRTSIDKKPVRIHHNAMPIGQVVPLPLDRLLDIDGSWQKGDFFYQPEVFWKRNLWEKSGGGVDENLFYSMDYELWVRFALNGAHILHIPDALALFRMHENQKTSGDDPPFLPELRHVAAKYQVQQ
jgi:ADP-heptose:LPS heptosyltransferase/GT2 family glycosyltransferase